MALRRGLAIPLALLGIVGVPVALLLSVGLLQPETGLERHRLVFCAGWIALSAAVWLRTLRRPRYGPVWALMSGLATASVVGVDALGLPALLAPLVGVLLTWAGPAGAHPANRDGSRRVQAGDPAALGQLHLLVQHERIVLKQSAGAGGAVPQALPLAELAFAQPGQFAGNQVHWWPLPGSLWTRMGTRPVLRLVAGPQQWLVPVPAPRELAAIIRERAAAAPRPEASAPAPVPLTLTQWYDLQAWAARQLTTSRRGGGLKQRTVGFRLVVALPAAFLGTGLLTEWIARGGGWGSIVVMFGAYLAVSAALVTDWARVRGRLRVAENNALPPGSPDWGDVRPDHAPLAGWQPWWEGPEQARARTR